MPPFDASLPAGQTSISPACYAHMTHMLLGLAPCVFVLEGGYNLDATAR